MMDDRQQHTQIEPSVGAGYEIRDANFKRLMMTGLALYGLIVVGLLISWGMYKVSRAVSVQPDSSSVTFVHEIPNLPEPRLQTRPQDDLLRMRESEDSILQSYAWVNRDSGFVRIPIDEAMNLLVRRGLPARRGQ